MTVERWKGSRMKSNDFKKCGREVDFIVQQQGNAQMLIQVCESMSNPKTYWREVKAIEDGHARAKPYNRYHCHRKMRQN